MADVPHHWSEQQDQHLLKPQQHTQQELAQRIEQAFEFRGHVTLVTRDGRELVGFLANRRADGPAPHVQLVLRGDGRVVTLPWEDVRDVQLTGRDPARRPLRQLAPVGRRPGASSVTAPVAIVAALENELAAFPLRDARREPFHHSFARCGTLGGTRVVLLATGPGRDNASRAMEELLEAGPIAALLNVGYAGGLEPRLRAGELVLATRVRWAGEPGAAVHMNAELASRVMASAAAKGLLVRSGDALTSDEALLTPEAKRAFAEETGATLAELESYWIARAAEARGLPWLSLRAIVDGAGEHLPPFAVEHRGRRTRDFVAPALRHALASPDGVLDLLRLAHAAARARRALAAAATAMVSLLATARREAA